MKKIIIVILLFAVCANILAQQQDDDVIWSKHLWWEYLVCGKISPDGQYVAVGSRYSDIFIYETETGDSIRTLKGKDFGNTYRSLSFTPTGDTLATNEDSCIYLFDVNTGEKISELLSDVMKQTIVDIDFSPDGRYLLAGVTWESGSWIEDSASVVLIDMINGEIVKNFEMPRRLKQLEYSPDGSMFAGVLFFEKEDEDLKNNLGLWDSETGEMIHEFNTEQEEVTDMAFSPDGRYIATTAYQNGPLIIWDIIEKTKFRDIIPNGYQTSQTVAFSPDSKKVALGTGGFETHSIQIWDFIENNLIYNYDNDTLAAIKALNIFDNLILSVRAERINLLKAHWHSVGIDYDNEIKDIEAAIIPNPANNTAKLQLNIPKSGKTRIEIIDSSGNLIDSVINKFLFSGEHEIMWNTKNYLSGVYFCRITCNELKKSIKFVISR